jgi:diguanylate cyclase (GGDEF)-like protein
VRTYQPRLNRVWVEAARLTDERYQTGRMGSLDKLSELVGECWRREMSGEGLMFLPGMQPIGRTISLVMKGLHSSWQGEFDAARVHVDNAIGSLGGIVTWLDSLVRWAVAELAWAQRDWPVAEAALDEMKSLALDVEHEQLACVAHLLLAQVFEVQGKHAQARVEHRALRLRERRMAGESLSSREAVVTWQLGARQSERHLQQALVASKQFERWSLEDALTGIANRRCFEQTLSERLRTVTAGSRPLTVAMIDLDQFKSVNDTFTHQVGDRVLKTLAGVMATAVRQKDLPARLAGDEFVVLFDDADEDVAEEICERIRGAIATFDWDSIAKGLRMTVSIGISQAVEGDTVESLLHRSDKSMYTVKPGWVPTIY